MFSVKFTAARDSFRAHTNNAIAGEGKRRRRRRCSRWWRRRRWRRRGVGGINYLNLPLREKKNPVLLASALELFPHASHGAADTYTRSYRVFQKSGITSSDLVPNEMSTFGIQMTDSVVKFAFHLFLTFTC